MLSLFCSRGDFLVEGVYPPADLVSILRMRQRFQIFLIPLDRGRLVLLLFVSFSDQPPRQRKIGLVANGQLEAINGGIVLPFLHVELADLDALGGMVGIGRGLFWGRWWRRRGMRGRAADSRGQRRAPEYSAQQHFGLHLTPKLCLRRIA